MGTSHKRSSRTATRFRDGDQGVAAATCHLVHATSDRPVFSNPCTLSIECPVASKGTQTGYPLEVTADGKLPLAVSARFGADVRGYRRLWPCCQSPWRPVTAWRAASDGGAEQEG